MGGVGVGGVFGHHNSKREAAATLRATARRRGKKEGARAPARAY